MKKIGLKGVVNVFSIDCDAIDTNNVLDIHRYLMKKTWCKIMSGFIKWLLIRLLTSVINASNHRKCVSLNNQHAMSHAYSFTL